MCRTVANFISLVKFVVGENSICPCTYVTPRKLNQNRYDLQFQMISFYFTLYNSQFYMKTVQRIILPTSAGVGDAKIKLAFLNMGHKQMDLCIMKCYEESSKRRLIVVKLKWVRISPLRCHDMIIEKNIQFWKY